MQSLPVPPPLYLDPAIRYSSPLSMGRPAKQDLAMTSARSESVLEVFARLQKEIKEYAAELSIPGYEDYNPLSEMAKMAVNPATPKDLQQRCNAELASYLYPKLKSMEVALPPGSEAKITIEIRSFRKQGKDIDAEYRKT